MCISSGFAHGHGFLDGATERQLARVCYLHARPQNKCRKDSFPAQSWQYLSKLPPLKGALAAARAHSKALAAQPTASFAVAGAPKQQATLPLQPHMASLQKFCARVWGGASF